MKIVLTLIAAIMMSACSHMGHKDHNHEGGKCAHCEKGEASTAKKGCSNGCH